jgi:molecular chaperone GrpE
MAQAEQNHASAADTDTEIERLKNELSREHEMYLRALADFENYRRRADRESSRAAQQGKRDLILSLLDVLDGFDRALQYMGDEPSGMSRGFEAIHRKFLDVLDRERVTPFQSIGETFDPALHEAVGSVRSEQYGPGAVVEEVQRGYRLGDEVLRPARVRVGQ